MLHADIIRVNNTCSLEYVAYLANLLVICNPADQSWPEAIRDIVGHPEPPQWWLIACLDSGYRCLHPVAKNVSGLRVLGGVWHQRGDDHMTSLDGESYLKFLE